MIIIVNLITLLHLINDIDNYVFITYNITHNNINNANDNNTMQVMQNLFKSLIEHYSSLTNNLITYNNKTNDKNHDANKDHITIMEKSII